MRRVYLVGEGDTEEQVAKRLLKPHLLSFGVDLIPFVVETSRDERQRKRRGGGDWSKWRKELARVLGQHGGGEEVVTTWFDLYGLPDGFPGLDRWRGECDTVVRVERLQQALSTEFDVPHFMPYLQRHETEALVFVDLAPLEAILDDPEDRAGVNRLRADVHGVPPEDIDDGKTTAPSKRLQSRIPSYRKTVHGVLTIEAIGLQAIRSQCPRFDAWVARLEALRQP